MQSRYGWSKSCNELVIPTDALHARIIVSKVTLDIILRDRLTVFGKPAAQFTP